MTTPVPSYLKLHRGEQQDAAGIGQPSTTDQFWSAFSAATGWRVDARHGDQEVSVLPAVEMDLMMEQPDDTVPPVVKENAALLAKHASEMAENLEQLQETVRQQEIELAASATAKVGEAKISSATHLVHQTLKQAVAATRFQAAAVYLLDDETQFLHTRAVFGMPDSKLTDDPRLLRGSRADLEAMVQQVVMIDNLNDPMSETWNVPESFGAAICVALTRGDLPVGTLWLYSEQPRKLDDSFAEVAKMAASQIILQLGEAARDRADKKNRMSRYAIRDISAFQYSGLPVGSQLAEGWFADGMIESPKQWSTGWHHWDVLPDGSIVVCIAEALESEAVGAMIANAARAGLAAHSGYRHTPRQMMQRLCDTLWQTNTEDQLISVLYAKIDPESGKGDVASAGNVSGMIGCKNGYRPLVNSGSLALASSMDVDCYHSAFHLTEGETLLAYGPGLGQDGISQDLIGCCLRTAMQSGQKPLTVLRREMASFPMTRERGLVSLTRSICGKPQ